jgi:hypothetical protein
LLVVRDNPNIPLQVSGQGLSLHRAPGTASRHDAMRCWLRKSTDGYGIVGVVCVSCRHDKRCLCEGCSPASPDFSKRFVAFAFALLWLDRVLQQRATPGMYPSNILEASVMRPSPDQKGLMVTIYSSSGWQISTTSELSRPNVFDGGSHVRLASVKVCLPWRCDWLHNHAAHANAPPERTEPGPGVTPDKENRAGLRRTVRDEQIASTIAKQRCSSIRPGWSLWPVSGYATAEHPNGQRFRLQVQSRGRVSRLVLGKT